MCVLCVGGGGGEGVHVCKPDQPGQACVAFKSNRIGSACVGGCAAM